MRRVLLLLAFPLLGARADDAAPTPEAIQRAIDAGVRWLKSAQKDDGSYGPCFPDGTYDGGPSSSGYRLGPTAFALYTLAVCGVPKEDPAIQRGLKWFMAAEHESEYSPSSYESSAVILMYCALNRVEAPKKLVRAAEPRSRPEKSPFTGPEWMRLDERVRQVLACSARGGFGYYEDDGKYADVSATQFAILALRAASFAGYPVEKIKPDVWSRTATYLRGLQDSAGGFPYHAPEPASRGMTAAALSSLLICREQIALLGERAPGSLAAALDGGLRYLDEHFDVEGGGRYHYCYLYAVERTGMISGRREFGGKSWYARGAAFLLEEQDAKGRWTDDTCMKPEDILGTCFALLFLKKATIPAVTR